MLVAMFRGIMMDDKLWEKPAEFYPDRFLLDGRIVIPDYFYPFGVGKHRCLGETLARANLFLFITTLLQNFSFLVPEGSPLPSEKLIDGATPGVRKYFALVKPR